MARQPRRRSFGEILIESFFGTFKRAMTTFALLFGLFTMFFPNKALHGLQTVINVIGTAAGPILPTLVALLLVCWGFWILLFKKK